MPSYTCRAEIVFRPGATNDPADAATKVDQQVHPEVADYLGSGFTMMASDREDLFEKVLIRLNEQQGLHAGYPDKAEKTSKLDWAFGSGGLHEDVRRVNQDGGLWKITGTAGDMIATMRLVSQQT